MTTRRFLAVTLLAITAASCNGGAPEPQTSAPAATRPFVVLESRHFG